MKTDFVWLMEVLGRSYGQLFLCGRMMPGLIFFLALCCISPGHALLSLLGCACLVLPVFFRSRGQAAAASGLLGVNGVLLGFSWLLLPEVSPWLKTAGTMAGAVVLVVLLAPLAEMIERRRMRLSFFSLPYVAAVWLLVALAVSFGCYDHEMGRGWRAYYQGDYRAAEAAFRAARMKTGRGAAYAADGLAWSLFKQGDYSSALFIFKDAAHGLDGFADPHDGMGWSLFRLGRFAEAAECFSMAVARDPWLADSWDGLGWVRHIQGRHQEAIKCFRRAVLICPLLPDTYDGLARSKAATGDRNETAVRLHALMSKTMAPRLWFVTSSQILGWLLFLAGVFVHSRRSGILLCVGLAGSVLLTSLLSVKSSHHLDVNLWYNLAALIIALGGHYIVPGIRSTIWTMAGAAGLVLAWPIASGLAETAGLPLLALPFNLALITIMLLHDHILPSSTSPPVPLAVAAGTPHDVRLWRDRNIFVSDCWKKIASARATH
ncbi:urea transporter [bacterium]|nr:urea transporter [candidate division CSSED10-310 bacterium]